MANSCGTSENPELTFSVIVLLPGGRGELEGSLAGWRGQQYPHARYELLGVSDGSTPDADEFVRTSPNRPDIVILEKGAHRSKLYDLGARAARGRFVVLTESHCLPQPDFLEMLDQYLTTTGEDGASCRSEPICADNVACMDHRLCEEGSREFRKKGDWRKINVHGVAIRRQAYLDAGGLDHRYGVYAEMVLAARFRDSGVRLGYADQAMVRHKYRSDLGEVVDFLGDIVNGECTYRRDHPGPDKVGFSLLSPLHPGDSNTDLLREFVKALAADVACRALWRGDLTTLRLFARALLWKWDSGVRAYWLARFKLARSALGCVLWRWHLPWLDRSFRQLCASAIRCAYLRWHAIHPEPPRADSTPRPEWRIADVAEQDLLGWHTKEVWHGDVFRWTGPVAVMRLPLAPGDTEIVLETRQVRRDVASCKLKAFFNGRRLPASAIIVERGVVRLVVPGEWQQTTGLQCLVLMCRPLRPWKRGVADRRELGLPIFTIRCHAPAAERGAARTAA